MPTSAIYKTVMCREMINKGRTVKAFLTLAPVLTMAMCKDAVTKHQGATKSADIFALDSAFAIREYIASKGYCPLTLPEWHDIRVDHQGREYVLRGNENGKYRVLFECNPNLTFSVAVFYSFDAAKYFTNTKTGEIKITYGHFTAPKYLYVKDRSMIVESIIKTYE